jgi:hypothetical protein
MFLGAGAVDQSGRATPDISTTISETTFGNSRSIEFFDRNFERQVHLVPGGTMVVNVLMDGTTYMDKFDPNAHCLIPQSFLQAQYSCWQVIASAYR